MKMCKQTCSRNGAVEVYRVLLMFLIVLYHSYCRGVFSSQCGGPGLYDWWTIFFDVLIIWHVGGFVAISGWYGIKFSWWKFLKLYGQILFYSLLGCGVYFYQNGNLPLSMVLNVRAGWFGGSYLMLMLVAPFVNAAVDHLRDMDGSKKTLLRSWCLIAFGVTCATMPYKLLTAINPYGLSSISFLTLLFVYTTARVARYLFETPIRARHLVLYVACYPLLALIPGLLLMMAHSDFGDLKLLHVWINYNLPHVWMMALVTLMLFVWHIKTPSWLNRACAWVAPSLFGVYLMHNETYGGKELYRVPTRILCDAGVHPFFAFIAASVIAFGACILIDLCRRLLVMAIVRLANCFRRRAVANERT